ncbi:Gfo/Idh/MocA family oxidoreductase [Paenibacillus sp. IB182496]|uniref:Gfo/Idh/MocA family oxidoreductase n=1 Tax=Paenibacillus sabuli TaxID=2772509 RepID=A0A927BTT5_9BACL|nr:Gfo/Idh/MocA family oxidoreductase [Paenibacillus sabuli]MBD2846673.1 Gfo/Idh/MocA family oxidoreductase [Paenibacillus sabuli]
MTGPLVNRPDIRLAMLGMVEGNGHPYSWSAIFNGYEPEAMARCPYPGIVQYLAKEPADAFGIPGARVTHIWTDEPEDAIRVSRAARIPHVVQAPEDVIGHVDAVLIATDIGSEHVARCRPFVEAGVPVFVDKPLADNAADLRQFESWLADGRPILSSSCMRYAKEFLPYRLSTSSLGALRFATMTMAKSWKRYGIHALEGLYPILGSGFRTVRNTGAPGRDIVHLTHDGGADIVIATVTDMAGAFGHLQLCGTDAAVHVPFQDTFYAFKAQLAAFVDYLRTGRRPFPHDETRELVTMVIAGLQSREQDGRVVRLDELQVTSR